MNAIRDKSRNTHRFQAKIRGCSCLVSTIMRYSEFGLTTLKEVPAEAELVSHQLMLRAGLIRRLAAGLQETLSHEEVKETAERVKETFIKLLTGGHIGKLMVDVT